MPALRMPLAAALALLGAAIVPGRAGAAPDQPSFDCAGARGRIEAAVCADPGLVARDRTMAQLYPLVRTDVLGLGPSDQLARQRQWLQSRDHDCAKAPDLAACLKGS